MNNPNTENPTEQTEEVVVEAQPFDSRRRLRELLSIPERDRSDEQWDEIIELEIQLAPGNRVSGNDASGMPPRHGNAHHGQHGKSAANAGGGPAQKKHRPRTKNNRRPRQNKPPSGGGAPA